MRQSSMSASTSGTVARHAEQRELRPSALRNSFLADVEPRVVEAIMEQAVVQHFGAGEVFVSETDPQWPGIVLSGMARIFLRTPAGRQVTLRHARAGGSIGVAAFFGPASIAAQAVTACQVLRLDDRQVVSLARTRPDLAWAVAGELSVRLLETYAEVVIRDQGSVHQRLARQLLHFGSVRDPDRPLELPISHSELADAVGSAREVVTRHLHQFQSEGLVRLERGRITITDPLRLHETASKTD